MGPNPQINDKESDSRTSKRQKTLLDSNGQNWIQSTDDLKSLGKQVQSGSVCLTSIVSWEVEQQDVSAEVGQVVQGFKMLLQFPIRQFGLQDGRQVTEHVGVQRRRPVEAKSRDRFHSVIF